MSFFDLQRFRREQDRSERAARALKLAEERIETLKWQQRSDEYERERQHYREQERLERDRENQREKRYSLHEEKLRLCDEIEDLKLRRKFGIEVGK